MLVFLSFFSPFRRAIVDGQRWELLRNVLGFSLINVEPELIHLEGCLSVSLKGQPDP